MKTLLLIFLCAGFTHASSSYVSDCSELRSDCEYYLCVESKKKCGSRGYLKTFGYKYCNKFTKNQNQQSSQQLIAWIEATKICLIDSISNLDTELTCRNLKKRAFKQHRNCYVTSGFCALPKRDKRAIFKTLGTALIKPRTIVTGIGVIKSCLFPKKSRFISMRK